MKSVKPEILVIAIGPGDPGLLTVQAADILQSGRCALFLRTGRHPVADWLTEKSIPFSTLDSFYSQYDDFDRMHQAMAAFLWNSARHEKIGFCVMDPSSDGAVLSLKELRPPEGSLRILAGVSASSACLSSLPVSVLPGSSLQCCTAASLLLSAPDPSLPMLITELDSSLLAGDVKLKLSDSYPDEAVVCFFPPASVSPRPVRSIPLYLLDSQKEYDHTAAVFLPGIDPLHRTRFTFRDLFWIVSRLRAPDGCPWDRIQTHESLRPYMVEEAWEAVSAIEEENWDHLADELGDVLFQVFIHASIGESYDEFTMTDVLSQICQKMIRRHPHVFQHASAETAREISEGWERMKRTETGSKTLGESLDDVSPGLPSLKYAIKVNKKLCQIPALRRPPEMIASEIRQLSSSLLNGSSLRSENLMSLLMLCTELCYRTDQDAEILLHQEVDRVKHAWQKAERQLLQAGFSLENLTLSDLQAALIKAQSDHDL